MPSVRNRYAQCAIHSQHCRQILWIDSERWLVPTVTMAVETWQLQPELLWPLAEVRLLNGGGIDPAR